MRDQLQKKKQFSILGRKQGRPKVYNFAAMPIKLQPTIKSLQSANYPNTTNYARDLQIEKKIVDEISPTHSKFTVAAESAENPNNTQ